MALSPTSSRGSSSGGSIAVTDGSTTVTPATTLDFTAGVVVTDAGSGQANASVTGGAPTFAPTATKTANYTTAAGEYVVGDSTAGAFTVTLPAAPANGSLVAVQNIGSANAITVAAGAGDTLNATTNSSLGTTRRSGIYEYRASDKVWIGVTPATNPVLSAGAFDGSVVAHGTATAVTFSTGTLDAIATAQPPTGAVALNSQAITGALLVAIAGGAGAAAATRLVGANATGAPASGTWNTGDVAVGQNGHMFVCTAGGTPGTWADVGSASNPNLATVLGVGNSAGSVKITSLANGTAAQDAAAYGQVSVVAGSHIGDYYGPISGWGSYTSNAGTQSVMHLTPIWLEAGTLDRIAQQHLATTAAETARLGIYRDSGRGYPGALLIDGGTIDLSTAVGIKTVTINQAVTRGLYWLACVHQGGGSATLVALHAASNPGPVQVLPGMAAAGTNLYEDVCAFTQSGVTGALPDPAVPNGFQTAGGNSLAAWVRYSA